MGVLGRGRRWRRTSSLGVNRIGNGGDVGISITRRGVSIRLILNLYIKASSNDQKDSN